MKGHEDPVRSRGEKDPKTRVERVLRVACWHIKRNSRVCNQLRGEFNTEKKSKWTVAGVQGMWRKIGMEDSRKEVGPGRVKRTSKKHFLNCSSETIETPPRRSEKSARPRESASMQDQGHKEKGRRDKNCRGGRNWNRFTLLRPIPRTES